MKPSARPSSVSETPSFHPNQTSPPPALLGSLAGRQAGWLGGGEHTQSLLLLPWSQFQNLSTLVPYFVLLSEMFMRPPSTLRPGSTLSLQRELMSGLQNTARSGGPQSITVLSSKQQHGLLGASSSGGAKSKANPEFLLLTANKNLAWVPASFAEIRYPTHKQVPKAGESTGVFLWICVIFFFL